MERGEYYPPPPQPQLSLDVLRIEKFLVTTQRCTAEQRGSPSKLLTKTVKVMKAMKKIENSSRITTRVQNNVHNLPELIEKLTFCFLQTNFYSCTSGFYL